MNKRPIHQRTDLMDTSDWAHRKMVELWRAMTPEQRIAKTFEMMEFMRTLRKCTEAHRQHPRQSSTLESSVADLV